MGSTTTPTATPTTSPGGTLQERQQPVRRHAPGSRTRLASYAAQEGNNGIGGIGACPCAGSSGPRGDGPWADANDFAKALVYAADNGASVAQAALRTVDMTTFARAAMDYAYAKGVVIVSAMGDDNARHHAFPGAYQHSLPVNSVR